MAFPGVLTHIKGVTDDLFSP